MPQKQLKNAKPKLCSTEEVKAIQEGRKSMFRVVIKPQPLFKTARKYIVPDDSPKRFHDCEDLSNGWKKNDE